MQTWEGLNLLGSPLLRNNHSIADLHPSVHYTSVGQMQHTSVSFGVACKKKKKKIVAYCGVSNKETTEHPFPSRGPVEFFVHKKTNTSN